MEPSLAGPVAYLIELLGCLEVLLGIKEGELGFILDILGILGKLGKLGKPITLYVGNLATAFVTPLNLLTKIANVIKFSSSDSIN